MINKSLFSILVIVVGMFLYTITFLWLPERDSRKEFEKEVRSLTIKIQDSQIKENKYRELINDFNKNFKNKPENISYDSTIVPDDIRSWLCTNSKGCL